ncbi:hypothetical protein [Chromobacterium subtsugae]|uniref:hypothetical protein n=1 Tax=Chromobacterium subtsugae TaxID=251747 RepID=UPI0006417297|nr:hypothetical protein [Chromobacterium subtsugae]
MAYFYLNGVFYLDSLEAPPAGAVPVSDDLHAQLMTGQTVDQTIGSDANGNPVLVPVAKKS